jgi:hypothetical protein
LGPGAGKGFHPPHEKISVRLGFSMRQEPWGHAKFPEIYLTPNIL